MNGPLALLLMSSALTPAAPAASARRERMTLYVGGARAGTLESLDEPLPGGGWKLTRSAQMEVRRGALNLSLRSRSVTEVDTDGKPRGFHYEREEAGGRMTTDGRATCGADGCTMDITMVVGDSPQKTQVKMPVGVTLGAGLELQARQACKAGGSWKGKVFAEELAALQDAEFTAVASAAGCTVKSSMGPVQTIETLDATGRSLRSEIPVMNAVAVPEGSPAPGGQGEKPLDVLASSTWKGAPLPPKPGRVRFTLTTATGDAVNIPQDRRQKVVTRKGKALVVEVSRVPEGLPDALTDAERKRALSSTPYEPLDDPRILAAAREARGTARTTREVVHNVVMWVFERVQSKDLARAYAPATATLQSREGDCTEHSVLASALLKANGVPTRIADGVIAFSEGGVGRLGYHEWVEVYLEGEGWVPADPTFGEPEAGPNRVKFANGSSDPADLMTMGLSAAAAFRGLTVTAEVPR